MASRAPRIASCRLSRATSGGVSSLSRLRRSGKTRRACLEANLSQVQVSTSSRPSRCNSDSVSRRRPSLGTMQAARKRSFPARRSARSRCSATVVFPQPASPRISTVSRGGSSTTARWGASSSTSTGEAGRARCPWGRGNSRGSCAGSCGRHSPRILASVPPGQDSSTSSPCSNRTKLRCRTTPSSLRSPKSSSYSSPSAQAKKTSASGAVRQSRMVMPAPRRNTPPRSMSLSRPSAYRSFTCAEYGARLCGRSVRARARRSSCSSSRATAGNSTSRRGRRRPSRT